MNASEHWICMVRTRAPIWNGSSQELQIHNQLPKFILSKVKKKVDACLDRHPHKMNPVSFSTRDMKICEAIQCIICIAFFELWPVVFLYYYFFFTLIHFFTRMSLVKKIKNIHEIYTSIKGSKSTLGWKNTAERQEKWLDHVEHVWLMHWPADPSGLECACLSRAY
jgi:hypothetical protein